MAALDTYLSPLLRGPVCHGNEEQTHQSQPISGTRSLDSDFTEANLQCLNVIITSPCDRPALKASAEFLLGDLPWEMGKAVFPDIKIYLHGYKASHSAPSSALLQGRRAVPDPSPRGPTQAQRRAGMSKDPEREMPSALL